MLGGPTGAGAEGKDVEAAGANLHLVLAREPTTVRGRLASTNTASLAQNAASEPSFQAATTACTGAGAGAGAVAPTVVAKSEGGLPRGGGGGGWFDGGFELLLEPELTDDLRMKWMSSAAVIPPPMLQANRIYLHRIPRKRGPSTAVAGAGPRGALGSEAADLGDVNDDGLRDFMITAPYLHETVDDPGSAYVVFGKLDGEPVTIADLELGIGGYAITGQATQDGFGYRADALGDLDGDGRVDFGVGALRTAYTQTFAGRVAVILSAPAPTSLLAADLAQGLGGFVIDGAAMNDGAWRVAGAGDVNGDGIPDILIGAGGVDEKFTDAGRAYVLFGPVCAP